MTKTQIGLDKGKVEISNDVVATISATAALEIEGVFAIASYTGGIPVFVRKSMGIGKGVKVTIAGNDVVLDLNIVVRFGYRILEVSENVQTRVKNAVQTMTGLNVRAVNVVVSSVNLEKEPAPKPPRKDKRAPKPDPVPSADSNTTGTDRAEQREQLGHDANPPETCNPE